VERPTTAITGEEDSMNTPTRVFFMLVWLGALALAGTIILSLTASRVGEHKSSTYGNAYVQFQNSWGGEIGIVPPSFNLLRHYTESQYNKDLKVYETVEKSASHALVPRTIAIDSDLNYGEQERDLLIFNAFEAKNHETYVIVNKSGYSGQLMVNITKPQNANLLYDYTITIPSRDNLVVRPMMDQATVLIPDIRVGEQVEVVITYSTKGMDIFKYNLSAYQNNVIEELSASININTRDFEIYRFGLPHETTLTDTGAAVQFNVDDFSTTQDLGVTFISKQRYLDQIQSLMSYSPMSLMLFLAVIFLFSQVHSVKFNAFHYLFLAMIDVFYYLFVAYLIRFFGVVVTFGISILLTTIMFLLYCPNVFGWRFASRIAGTYLFLLTVVFSLIFLMPIFRGLMFVILIFVIFMSIMISVSRSDISKWNIVTEASAA
jgi:inner membrane protein involved in colicin E2 resistance